jgi:redox-sensing transcriptional repressor
MLRKLWSENKKSVMVREFADYLRTPENEMRAVLASLTGSGRLRDSYDIKELITESERCLGYYNRTDVALIGTGRAAKGLLLNTAFSQRGFNLSYIFDFRENETTVCGKTVRPVSDLYDAAKRAHLHLGIIACAQELAQRAADIMAEAGILAIWNVSGTKIGSVSEIMSVSETFGEHEEIESNEAVPLTLMMMTKQLGERLGLE